MPLAGVERELCTLAGRIASSTCRFLCLLADFDARQGWAWVDIRSCAHWLSWRCGLDLRTAREQLRVARSLATLPLLQAAFAAGRISYSKVRAIARVGTPDNEADLVDAALHAPAAHIERLTRGLKTAQSNSGDPAKARSAKDRMGVRWHWDIDGTFVFWGRLSTEDGARLLAATVRADNERTRTQEPESPSQTTDPDPNPHADRPSPTTTNPITAPPSDLGPALVAMAEMVCAGIEAPLHAPGADVIVAVDADTLFTALSEPDPCDDRPTPAPAPSPAPAPASANHETATHRCGHQHAQNPPESSSDDDQPQNNPDQPDNTADQPDNTADQPDNTADQPQKADVPAPTWHYGARIEDGPALYAASLRKLADDGRLRTAVIAGDGRTVNLGRARRTVSDRQFLALWRRDHGCAVPGCGRIRFLHAHHVVFWSRGGRTDLDNLVLLCGEHHRALHNGAFTIQALGHQQFTFHTRNGSRHLASPPVRGNVNDLTNAHPDITEETIIPNWDGNPISLHWAVGGYLDTWAAERNAAASAA